MVRAFAPGSLSNMGCGVDVMGVALDGIGDFVTARPCENHEVHLDAVRGDDGRLPREAGRNTCAIAASALIQAAGSRAGVRLELDKGLPLSSGLGSSAASAVAAVVAVNELLDLGADRNDLLTATLAAEEATCGAAHPDNVSPSLWGGWVTVRHGRSYEVLSLPCPEDLTFAVVRPHVELATRTMRELLPSEIPFAEASGQWSHLAALVHALHSSDLDLIARSMIDQVAEPRRAAHVPGFRQAREAALGGQALAAGLSGSGPSIFALARRRDAETVRQRMTRAITETTDLEVQSFLSNLPARGAYVVESQP